ncbi:MAG: nucleoside deaminase [Deltaproteobacteria bacterium]|nr:nucleoside deaminase [Deltaproteobacteria bacterium]MBT4087959.1 nucleoside deaminase [Deltaproteobacteria bacterium]MBT4268365.1 nucleoside deaminase [Deltaproteobacteria bacterium]MBT4638986.1 nucleoside deaminase [Deltaproteobacteria bacterium]MBT6611180.1 nucleoside deaminase [Deltaproteobacteria bacterium]
MSNDRHLNTQKEKPQLIQRLLQVIEQEIIPLTDTGVRKGNKVFGAAILRKSDFSTVIAATNNETANPLWHGEMHAIKLLYEMVESKRPHPSECIFLATHEPCTLCLSAITWGGYDNFYYLFSHEDSRDSFQIGHDLKILKQLFKLDPGEYNRGNEYWKSESIRNMIIACESDTRDEFLYRIEELKKTYAELSAIYQQNKGNRNIIFP